MRWSGLVSSITCRCHASSRHALTRPVRPSTGLLYSTGVHHRAAVARRYSFRIGHALTVTSLDLKGKINASAVHCAGTGSRDPVGRNAIRIGRPPNLISSAIMDGRPLAGRSASSRAYKAAAAAQQKDDGSAGSHDDDPSIAQCGVVWQCARMCAFAGDRRYVLPACTYINWDGSAPGWVG